MRYTSVSLHAASKTLVVAVPTKKLPGKHVSDREAEFVNNHASMGEHSRYVSHIFRREVTESIS